MNVNSLNKIKSEVSKATISSKENSNEIAGVYLHGSSLWKTDEHYAPLHAFRAFSYKHYPLLVLVPEEHQNNELVALSKKLDFKIITIRPIKDVIDFNYFSIYELLFLEPVKKFENLLYFQSDGFLIRKGWDHYVLQNKFDFIGAPWRSHIKVVESVFNFPGGYIGNGGFNFRKRSKCIDVLHMIAEEGGQNQIVKGIQINNKLANSGPFLQEDLFFSYFGFGKGIFKPVTVEQARKFSIEPITWNEYNNKESYGFHRIDE